MALQYAEKGGKVKPGEDRKQLWKVLLILVNIQMCWFSSEETEYEDDTNPPVLKCHKNHCCHYPSTKPSLSSLFSMIPSGLHAIVSFELAGRIVLCPSYPQLPHSIPHLFSKRKQNSKDTK